MLKSLLALVFTIIVSLNCFAQNKEVNQLRGHYLIALHDYEEAPEVYKIFENVENPSGKILAYKGALEAIMTKTTWNVFKKIGFLKESEATFKEAIKKSPENVEIRFMRMAVQYEIPEYLGFSEDMEEDRKFIVNHIKEFDTSALSVQTLKEIFGFMTKCGRFTEEQIETFRGILALNN